MNEHGGRGTLYPMHAPLHFCTWNSFSHAYSTALLHPMHASLHCTALLMLHVEFFIPCMLHCTSSSSGVWDVLSPSPLAVQSGTGFLNAGPHSVQACNHLWIRLVCSGGRRAGDDACVVIIGFVHEALVWCCAGVVLQGHHGSRGCGAGDAWPLLSRAEGACLPGHSPGAG